MAVGDQTEPPGTDTETQPEARGPPGVLGEATREPLAPASCEPVQAEPRRGQSPEEQELLVADSGRNRGRSAKVAHLP